MKYCTITSPDHYCYVGKLQPLSLQVRVQSPTNNNNQSNGNMNALKISMNYFILYRRFIVAKEIHYLNQMNNLTSLFAHSQA